jgi:hypothetical protein
MRCENEASKWHQCQGRRALVCSDSAVEQPPSSEAPSLRGLRLVTHQRLTRRPTAPNNRKAARRLLGLLAVGVIAVSVGASDARSNPRARTGGLLFDGRATKMTEIHSIAIGDQRQVPALWDCLCFLNDNIRLVSNKRFGRVYSISVGAGSHNPWWNGGPRIASAEVTTRRPVRLGQWDWYADSFLVLPGFVPPDFAAVAQMNYPTITSPPLEIDFDKYGVGISRSVGYVPSVSGKAEITDSRRFYKVSDVVGKWVDFVIGVKWATNATGSIRVYTRCAACAGKSHSKASRAKQRKLALRYTRDSIVTMQWGAGVMTADGKNAEGRDMLTIDHAGLYFGYAGIQAMPTNRLLQSGLVRASDMATAAATLR